MTVDLTRYKTLIFVFVMDGCGACEDYLPTFLEVAKVYERCIPVLISEDGETHDVGRAQAAILILDAANPKYEKYADHFKIQETPTTVILFRRNHASNFSATGALDEGEVNDLFMRAMRGLSCEI
jgi:thiol-disulfide isomerase/thioredoxin